MTPDMWKALYVVLFVIAALVVIMLSSGKSEPPTDEDIENSKW